MDFSASLKKKWSAKDVAKNKQAPVVQWIDFQIDK